MIIKIIPETPEEKKVNKKIEHVGVKDFFFCGNKKSQDGGLVDWHDYRGSYRFLEGSLLYFSNIISEERRTKEKAGQGREIELTPQSDNKPPFIKTGEIENIQVINTETMGRQISVPFGKDKNENKDIVVEAEEMPVEENNNNPEDQAGDDK